MANMLQSDDLFLQMSNGSTDVFISLLAISGSILAESAQEIRLITCIASCDQGIFGSGVVGFDLVDLPWSTDPTGFKAEQMFLINVIERVISQQDWHILNYKPDIEMAIKNQHQFLDILQQLNVEQVQPFDAKSFYLPTEIGQKCDTHGVYLHIAGCIICNNL